MDRLNWFCFIVVCSAYLLFDVQLVTAKMSCGQTSFSGSYGRIETPNYPRKYPAGMSCSYKIRVSSGQRIELKWNSFDVDGDMPDCKDDYVEVLVGCSRNRLSRFCTRNAAQPHKIYTVNNCLELVFRSSSASKGGYGFAANYITKSQSEKVQPSLSYCSKKYLYSKSGVVYSPNYPVTAPRLYRDCEWKIRVNSDYVIKLNIMDVDTHKYAYCSHSFSTKLKVKGEKSRISSESKRYFCGINQKPTYLKTKYYQLELEFDQGTYSSSGSGRRGVIVGYVAYKYDFGTTTSLSKVAVGGIVIAFIIVIGCCLFFICRGMKRRRQARSSASYTSAAQEPIATTTTISPPKGPSYGAAAPPPYSATINQPAGYQGYPAQQYAPPASTGYPGPYPPSGPAPYPPSGSAPYASSGPPPYPTGPPQPGASYNPGAPYPPTNVHYPQGPPPTSAPYPPVSSEAQKASAPPYP